MITNIYVCLMFFVELITRLDIYVYNSLVAVHSTLLILDLF
jgi:hypothetical protein